MIDTQKIRELLISDSESDVKLGLQIMANRDHTSAFRDHKPELWLAGKKDVLCDRILYGKNGVFINSCFVQFHEHDVTIGSEPDWWIVEERTGKVIEKYDVIDLHEGYALSHDTEIHLDFWSRIRVLFGARFFMKHECSTDKMVCVSKGKATITIGKPKRMIHQMESFNQSGPQS